MAALLLVLATLYVAPLALYGWTLLEFRRVLARRSQALAPTRPEPVVPASSPVVLDWPDRGMIRHDRAA